MDYARLSEESLDEIMKKIRTEIGLGSTIKTPVIKEEKKGISTLDNDFHIIDKYLNDAIIGKQVGLHKAPMYRMHGIKRILARLVERVYLRVADLTNRDVRAFNSRVLTIFHEMKKKLESQGEVIEIEQEQRRLMETNIDTLKTEMRVEINSQKQALDEQAKINNERNEINELRIRELTEQAKVIVERNITQEIRIRELNEQVTMLKSIVHWTNNAQFTKTLEKKVGSSPLDNPVFYHDFEERFRGTREDIKDRLRIYLPKITEHFGDWANKTFVDIGTGRGEWMDLLKEHGVNDYIGVDLNDIQLNICREYGHQVEFGDCLDYLRKLPDSSVDMITGFQIIEHLPLEVLLTLFAQSYRVLKKDGMVLFETPNPSNILTAATYFYTDPTHIRPLHKDAMRFYAERSGFSSVSIIEVNPARYSQTLINPICSDGNQEVWNMNIELMNNLLYGAQDYAVVGIKHE